MISLLKNAVMAGASASVPLLSVRDPSIKEFHYEARSNMKVKKPRTEHRDKPERQTHRVRLPGFVTDEDVGLGDLIKRATYAIGIKPCGGCQRRAAALNRWMTFSGRR